MADTVTIPASLLADLIHGCETAAEELLERVPYCYGDEESAESYSTAAESWESVADRARRHLPKD